MGRPGKLIERPYGPYIVLMTAILLPGAGHVLVGQVRRGLMLQMFIILLGMITWHLTTPDRSLVGRLAGGLFVYAVSIPDAYRTARMRATLAAAREERAAPTNDGPRSSVGASRLSS